MSGFTDGLRNFDYLNELPRTNRKSLGVFWWCKSWIARGEQSVLKSEGVEATGWNRGNT